MSDPNTLGSLVRKRRLESGYSLGQLASKVGKTAAEVRAWERDVELPEHGIIDRLASTLEIDLAEIKKRMEAGKKALDAERKAAQQTAVGEDNEDGESEPAVIFPEQIPAPADEPAEKVAERLDEEESEEDLPGFVVANPFTQPPPLEDDANDSEDEPDLGLLDAPTEAVPVPVITGTAAAARASRAAAVLEEPAPAAPRDTLPDQDAGLLRYLEPVQVLFDPHQRYLYWIRAGLTVIVLLILAAILFAQLGNLLDAISELLDTIEPAASDPDDLNAFGLLPFI